VRHAARRPGRPDHGHAARRPARRLWPGGRGLMRFSAIHKVASYLMVAAAFAALALSRELSMPGVLFTLVGGALSFWAEPSRPGWAFLRSRGWSLGWNLSTLAVFGWTVLDTLRAQALFAGVRFLCFLLVNKLWNRRASRDYLQAYVVSFLMLVA